MARIVGIEGLTNQQIDEELAKGAKFVIYYYCVSIIVMSFRRSSEIQFVRAGDSRLTPGLPLTLLTLVVGWWGIPWGPIYTIQSLYTNLRGGKDVTDAVLASANR